MPLTYIVIIYSIAQNRRRRVIISDNDDKDYDAHLNNIHPNEAIWKMSISDYQAGISIDDGLSKHLGVIALSDRCVVLDAQGNVICVIKGDPAIDIHPTGKIYQHDIAIVGWRLQDSTWINLPSVTDITFDINSLATVTLVGI